MPAEKSEQVKVRIDRASNIACHPWTKQTCPCELTFLVVQGIGPLERTAGLFSRPTEAQFIPCLWGPVGKFSFGSVSWTSG